MRYSISGITLVVRSVGHSFDIDTEIDIGDDVEAPRPRVRKSHDDDDVDDDDDDGRATFPRVEKSHGWG